MSDVLVPYVSWLYVVCFFEWHWCEDSLRAREHGVHSELHRLLSTGSVQQAVVVVVVATEVVSFPARWNCEHVHFQMKTFQNNNQPRQCHRCHLVRALVFFVLQNNCCGRFVPTKKNGSHGACSTK